MDCLTNIDYMVIVNDAEKLTNDVRVELIKYLGHYNSFECVDFKSFTTTLASNNMRNIVIFSEKVSKGILEYNGSISEIAYISRQFQVQGKPRMVLTLPDVDKIKMAWLVLGLKSFKGATCS